MRTLELSRWPIGITTATRTARRNSSRPGGVSCFSPHTPTRCGSTSWPEFSQHAWAGAWVNSLFRNERPRTHEDPDGYLSSELIAEAVAATRAMFGEPPALGMVSFVDSSKVRHKRDPGRCYRRAGWRHVGFTKDLGLHVFQQLPEDMPPAVAPLEVQMRLAI